jgi:hypothetical protein
MIPGVRRSTYLAVVVAAVGFAMSRPCLAQRLEWQPRVFLFQSRTDNVRYVETQTTQGTTVPASDTYTTLGLELPVQRTTRTSSYGFNYFGVFSRYSDFGLYDNFSHGGTFYFRPVTRRGASFSIDGFATWSQDQGASPRFEDDEQFVSQRTDRRFYGVGAQYGQAGRLWSWSTGLRVARSEFDAIEGTLPTDPVPPDPEAVALIPEGRTYWTGRFDFRREITRRFAIGPRYNVGYTDLERNGTDVYHTLTFGFNQQVSEYFSYGLGAGLSRRSTDDPTAGETSATDFAWSVTLGISPPLPAIESGKVKVDFDIGITPTFGGSLEGASSNSYARLYVSSGTPRSTWSWGAGGRYTRRDSTLDDYPTLQTLGVTGQVEYGLGSLVSLSLGAGWSRQLAVEAGETNASFGALRLGLVVYPRGRAHR